MRYGYEDFKKMLEQGMDFWKEVQNDPTMSRLEFLSSHIFMFTAYDSDVWDKFAAMAVMFCNHASKEHNVPSGPKLIPHDWYYVMLNMPFFRNRVEWGSSPRGLWWKHSNIVYKEGDGLWLEGSQINKPIEFADQDHWKEFIQAVIDFGQDEALQWFAENHPNRPL